MIHFPAPEHNHGSCIAEALRTADTLCATKGARLTPTRRRVLEVVWRGHRPVGAYEILDVLRAEGKNAQPPTVYRALEFLQEQGLIHRIALLNAYTGCGKPGQSHDGQFLICTSCRSLAEITDDAISSAIAHRAKTDGFKIAHTTVEIEGLCPTCQSAPRP